MQSDVSYFRPQQDLPDRVELDSPAILVMTDLRVVPAVTIEATVSIDDALKKMRHDGVRMLLVTDAQNLLQGLITVSDIHGEKPMRHLKQAGGHHDDIEVRHIMTPHEHLEVLTMADVLRAAVGDIVATLQHAGRPARPGGGRTPRRAHGGGARYFLRYSNQSPTGHAH